VKFAAARLILAFALLVVAGCGASAASGTEGNKTSPTTSAVAASIEKPLDVRGRAVCSILTPQQLAALRMDATSALDDSNELSGSCRWKSPSGDEVVTVDMTATSGIERAYAALEVVGDSERFDIDGYPAVREGAYDSSICTVYVGVAEMQAISVQVSSRSLDSSVKPCNIAERTASAVIDSLSSRS
jgi:hypothetical protein